MGWMPIMGTNLAIHFAALNEEWAQRNHNQSLQRLAARGGLAPEEALAILELRNFRTVSVDEVGALARLVEKTRTR